MTRDEVIEAFSKGSAIKADDGRMGKIAQIDDRDSTVTLEGDETPASMFGKGRWIKWDELSAMSEEDEARAKAAAEAREQARPILQQKFAQAVVRTLTSAPRVAISEAKMANIKEDRRALDHRLVAVFAGSDPLIVSLDENGLPAGLIPPGLGVTIDDITLIED